MVARKLENDEAARLAALKRCSILDTPVEESFDRITELAKTAVGFPIALVTLVDQDRQWFKSKIGIDINETPREISFCTHAIESPEPFIVEDALKDRRFVENPLVKNEPNIRSYFGIPLQLNDGHIIGTLCVIDRRPRKISPRQIEILSGLARIIVDEISLRQMALTDALTGAMNRRSFNLQLGREIQRHRRYGNPLGLVCFDLDHFKLINDKHGHAAGDAVLRSVALTVSQTLRPVDLFCRTGGEEFAVALPETRLDGSIKAAERLRHQIELANTEFNGERISVTASFGVTELASQDEVVNSLLDRADAALYRAKSAGRNRVESAAPWQRYERSGERKVA